MAAASAVPADARGAALSTEDAERELRVDFALIDEDLDGRLLRDAFVNH